MTIITDGFFVVFESHYILVYNAFWLTPFSPRRTIYDEVSEILAVVDSESRGPNMETVPRGRFLFHDPVDS